MQLSSKVRMTRLS